MGAISIVIISGRDIFNVPEVYCILFYYINLLYYRPTQEFEGILFYIYIEKKLRGMKTRYKSKIPYNTLIIR